MNVNNSVDSATVTPINDQVRAYQLAKNRMEELAQAEQARSTRTASPSVRELLEVPMTAALRCLEDLPLPPECWRRDAILAIIQNWRDLPLRRNENPFELGEHPGRLGHFARSIDGKDLLVRVKQLRQAQGHEAFKLCLAMATTEVLRDVLREASALTEEEAQILLFGNERAREPIEAVWNGLVSYNDRIWRDGYFNRLPTGPTAHNPLNRSLGVALPRRFCDLPLLHPYDARPVDPLGNLLTDQDPPAVQEAVESLRNRFAHLAPSSS